ncbi:hypothetical protein SLS62_011373 [Diatrype stigma]|uniref:Uncharacterized protein n=1 Tax=Diatrype stigma TaxID=117547 RepID=A0AAN9UAX0_9PEZI
MAPTPALLIPEQGPLLLDVSDEHYDVVPNEAVEGEEGEDESGTLLPDAKPPSDSSRSSRLILVQLCFVMLLFDFTQYSVYAPLTEVFEDIICNNFYPPGSPERDCKSVPVQSELALVKGYKDAFNQIPILKAVGGGANFGTSMFYTAVADVIEEKHRTEGPALDR